MEQQQIFRNGRMISLLRHGPVNPDQTIVFIHGFPFAKEMWRDQLKAMPDGVEAIAYDIRGFGDSNVDTFFFYYRPVCR